MALTKITGGVVSTTSDYQVGVLTATKFVGDGSGLTGVASTDNIVTATPVDGTFTGDGSALTGVGGLGDPQGSTSNLNYLFTSPQLLELTQSTTINPAASTGKVVFTASESIKVSTGATVEIGAGTTIRTNVLGLY